MGSWLSGVGILDPKTPKPRLDEDMIFLIVDFFKRDQTLIIIGHHARNAANTVVSRQRRLCVCFRGRL